MGRILLTDADPWPVQERAVTLTAHLNREFAALVMADMARTSAMLRILRLRDSVGVPTVVQGTVPPPVVSPCPTPSPEPIYMQTSFLYRWLHRNDPKD